MDYKKIGLRLRAMRKRQNMSQQDLAYEIEYSIPHISHVENGSTKLSVDFLVKASNALAVTADQLLCDSLDYADKVYQGEIMEELKDLNDTELKIIRQLIIDAKKSLRQHDI